MIHSIFHPQMNAEAPPIKASTSDEHLSILHTRRGTPVWASMQQVTLLSSQSSKPHCHHRCSWKLDSEAGLVRAQPFDLRDSSPSRLRRLAKPLSRPMENRMHTNIVKIKLFVLRWAPCSEDKISGKEGYSALLCDMRRLDAWHSHRVLFRFGYFRSRSS